jgi:hypothetical protein
MSEVLRDSECPSCRALWPDLPTLPELPELEVWGPDWRTYALVALVLHGVVAALLLAILVALAAA